MKKYFKIVNRVIYSFILLATFCCYGASNTYAQAERPIIDSGDGRGVMPAQRATPTSSVKFLEEAEESFNNLRDFELNISQDALNRVNQTPTPTPAEVTTGVIRAPLTPTPFITQGAQNSEIGSLAQRITQRIHSNCVRGIEVGIINRNNKDCVDSIIPLVSQNGLKTAQHLKDSASMYQNVQCVGCTKAMAEANGLPYVGFGNAVNHISQVVPGYRYVSATSLTPQSRAQLRPGTIFVTSDGTFGHIGVIIRVNVNSAGEADSFVAQECNWSKPGYFQFGRIIDFSQVAGFQVPII